MKTSKMKPKVSIKKKKLIIVKRPKCCICLEKVGKARTKLECGHSFCTKCILGWVLTDHNTCPMCRQDMCCVLDDEPIQPPQDV